MTMHSSVHGLVFEKNSENIAEITKKLHEEAKSSHGMPRVEEVSFSAKNDTGEVIAGIVGYIMYGSVFIDILWVEKAFRRKGLGRKLVTLLEEYALSKGVKFSFVTSMSFWKALDFYKKLGYEVTFSQHGFSHNAKQYTLKKEL